MVEGRKEANRWVAKASARRRWGQMISSVYQEARTRPIYQLTASGVPTQMPQSVDRVVGSRAGDESLGAELGPLGELCESLHEGSRVEGDAYSRRNEVANEEGVESCSGRKRRQSQGQSAGVRFWARATAPGKVRWRRLTSRKAGTGGTVGEGRNGSELRLVDVPRRVGTKRALVVE